LQAQLKEVQFKQGLIKEKAGRCCRSCAALKQEELVWMM